LAILIETKKDTTMFFSMLLALFVFIGVLLMIRTSYLNTRMAELEDYVQDCVTKDYIKELVMASIQDTLTPSSSVDKKKSTTNK